LSQYSQLSNTDLIEHIDRVGVVIYDRDAEEFHRNGWLIPMRSIYILWAVIALRSAKPLFLGFLFPWH